MMQHVYIKTIVSENEQLRLLSSFFSADPVAAEVFALCHGQYYALPSTRQEKPWATVNA
jgi:hypothetical protein